MIGQPNLVLAEKSMLCQSRLPLRGSNQDQILPVIRSHNTLVTESVLKKPCTDESPFIEPILVVEEHIVTQAVVSQMLIQLGCQVKVIEHDKTASRIIRQPERIIALPTDAMVGDREHCLTSGKNDPLGKPIKYKKFYKILARWLTSTVSIPLTKTIFPLESVDSLTAVSVSDKTLLNNRLQNMPKHGINWLIDLYLKELPNYIKTLKATIHLITVRLFIRLPINLKVALPILGGST